MSHLFLLGAPKLETPRGSVALERKTAAVLAYLALEGPTPKYKLSGWLWPASGETTARNNIRQLLRRLRLAGGEVVRGEKQLELAGELVIDVKQFSYLEASSLELLRQEAELLAGFDYDDAPDFAEWLASAREELRSLRLRMAEIEASRLAKTGDVRRALEYAALRLGLDRLSEDAYRQVARLHYLLGDRGAALATLARCRRVLAEELGVEPLPETLELGRLIEGGGDLPGAPPRPRSAVLPEVVLRPPLLAGRDREWEVMEQAWAAGKLIYLSAAPGVGKSRLAEDFIASKGGYFRSAGRPGDRHVPHAFGIRFVRTALEIGEGELPGWARRALASLMPEFDPAPEPLGPEPHLRLAEAYLEVMRGLGRRNQALLIDDVHFMDDASVGVGVYMFSLLSPLGGPDNIRGFVACFRRGELSPFYEEQVAELVNSGVAIRIELEPLAPATVDTMLKSLGLANVERLSPGLHAYTGGNPLFILETLKHLIETDTLDQGLPARLAPPGKVATLVGRRLQGLSPTALNLARTAAVAGTRFDLELAANALERSPFELAQAHAELEQAQVMCGYTFSHDLLCEAVLKGIPTAVGQLLHARTARHLEGLDANPGVIAYHWLEAERVDAAAPWLLRAAERARNADLSAEAFGLLEQAVGLYERASRPATRLATLRAALDHGTPAQRAWALAELESFDGGGLEPQLQADLGRLKEEGRALAGSVTRPAVASRLS